MTLLPLIAAAWAAVLLLLAVPPEARDFGYYLNGAVLLIAIGILATDRRDR